MRISFELRQVLVTKKSSILRTVGFLGFTNFSKIFYLAGGTSAVFAHLILAGRVIDIGICYNYLDFHPASVRTEKTKWRGSWALDLPS